jgi:hypothetical protein
MYSNVIMPTRLCARRAVMRWAKGLGEASKFPAITVANYRTSRVASTASAATAE